ncbi:MAG: DUF1579 family protein [Planctomycetota bacterium]
MRRLLSAWLVAALPALAVAQEPTGPAPELKQLEPLVGNWHGSGEATFAPGAPPTKWAGNGTYAWVLGGHWLQEDFALEFDGLPTPMVKHAFLGWDRSGKRYVKATCGSNGEVALHELVRLGDGTFVEMTLQHRDGMPYAGRSTLRATKEGLVHTIDVWMAEGPMQAVTAATFTRGGEPYAADLATPAFLGEKPHASLTRLSRAAGDYATAGTVVPAPGEATIQLAGVDSFRTAFGGMILLGESHGAPAGSPVGYEGRVLYGYDANADAIVGIYVGSAGEIMRIEARWLPDGRLLSTGSVTIDGSTKFERYLMEFDQKGGPTRAVGHTLMDGLPPFESYRATYTRK